MSRLNPMSRFRIYKLTRTVAGQTLPCKPYAVEGLWREGEVFDVHLTTELCQFIDRARAHVRKNLIYQQALEVDVQGSFPDGVRLTGVVIHEDYFWFSGERDGTSFRIATELLFYEKLPDMVTPVL